MLTKLLENLMSNATWVLAILALMPLLYAVVFARSSRGYRRVRGLLRALRNPRRK
ncbi:MAG: hypothetical protein J0J03_10680 [Leifsonia sp.]|nr:hypothetical protein [Leifsonia sp.]